MVLTLLLFTTTSVQMSGWTIMTGTRDTTSHPQVFIFSLTHPPSTSVLGEDSLPPCHCCPALTAILGEFGANPSKLGRTVQTHWISLGFRSCYGDRLKHLAPNMPLVCWKQNFNSVVTMLTLLCHRAAAPYCSIQAGQSLPCLLLAVLQKRCLEDGSCGRPALCICDLC